MLGWIEIPHFQDFFTSGGGQSPQRSWETDSFRYVEAEIPLVFPR